MKSLMKARPLCVVLFALVCGNATCNAQTFTLLKSFNNSPDISGGQPRGQLVRGSDGTLYGTTSGGGDGAEGAVFKILPDGSGFGVLKLFNTRSEGAEPLAGLALAGDTLYGTTLSGGTSNAGAVFKVNTDGTEFTVLKHFAGSWTEAGNPVAGLTVSGNVIYGATSRNGGNSFGWGAVFRINTDGTDYAVLQEFNEGGGIGLIPTGRLLLHDGVLYGTTLVGGSGDSSCCAGTVFRINTDGTGYRTLKEFAGTVGEASNPEAGLTLFDGVLYGTTVGRWGGFYTASSLGTATLYKLNTDGTGFAVLKKFNNREGSIPRGDLIISKGVIFGVTSEGGEHNLGTLYKINTDGIGFAVLRHFSGAPGDGAEPWAGLTLIDTALYGTTYQGGSMAFGTIFKLDLNTPCSLDLTRRGNDVVLNWTNAAYSLQQGSAAAGPYTSLAGATSPYTNTIVGGGQFFRLVGTW